MIRGMMQVVEHESAASRLFYTVTDDEGREATPDAAPKIVITDPGGTELVASTNMTIMADITQGYLNYDAQTAEFGIGETLTGGTSDATAVIVWQTMAGAKGTLRLQSIDGVFENNEAITDSGAGVAVADLVLYQRAYYYDVNASSTADYTIERNYCATISYDLSARGFVRRVYFDVAFYPMGSPVVTTEDIDQLYSHWAPERPQTWVDWTPGIFAAHRKLVNKIHSLGEQAAHFIKREEEMYNIAFEMTLVEIMRALRFTAEDIAAQKIEAAAAWSSRGYLTVDTDADVQVDGGDTLLTSGRVR